MKTTNRLLSLDVMRGITIAGMILVNDPGSWSYVYAPLQHAQWDGLTPTDLVFPFFMFIMGISMYLSLRKYNFKLNAGSLQKIITRTIVIFLVGIGLNLFSHVLNNGFQNFENLRILGVMQRLAIAYGIGSIIGLLLNGRSLLPVSFLLLTGYALLLTLTDSLTLSIHNIIGVVDKALFGETHIYRDWLPDGTMIRFDPEGLLSSIGSIAQVLLGFYAGKIIMENQREQERILRYLFIFGSLILFAGFLLSYGCPINKKLWSATFVLVTSGFGSLFLALLIWNIDINHHRKWTLFFETFGINPLYLYIQAAILAKILSKTGIQEHIYNNWLVPYLGNYPASFVWAILFVLINWIPGYFLYKRRIYIKI